MPSIFKTTRILIVDDDEDDYFITSDYIREINQGDYQVEWANTYKTALAHMRNHNHDIYIVDYRLGTKTGLDLLKEAIDSNCEEPIILLTGKGNREIDQEAMQIGAFDYLVKSELNAESLERTIRYALERSANINAIRRNERKFRNIFERSLDAVFITDMDLRVKDMNKAANQLLGYSVEQMEDKILVNFFSDHVVGERIKLILMAGHDVNDCDIEIVTSNGNQKSCILSASVETDISGESYVQGILHDITNLKKAEWLTLQTEKLAATGRLVKTLAHEVRNPLNNITLSAEQLQAELKESNNVYLEVIQRNSERISSIIDELLNTSRPTQIELVSASINDLIDEALNEAYDSIVLQEINLVKKVHERPMLVLADKEKLKIAFRNIIVNAVEAIELHKNGRGEIEISINEQNGFAVAEIADNGGGITLENMEKLFEPYFTSKPNGMGLGLALSLNIIQSHKGFIEVKSTEGKGTSFIVNIPIHE